MVNKYIIEIIPKTKNFTSIIEQLKHLGYYNIEDVAVNKIYSITGNISKTKVLFITKKLLVDPIAEDYNVKNKINKSKYNFVINIWYKPQVLDIVAIYVEKAVKYLGLQKKIKVRCGTQICIKFSKKINIKELKNLIEKIFMNPLIQEYEIV